MGQTVYLIQCKYSDDQTYSYTETVAVSFDEVEALKLEEELKDRIKGDFLHEGTSNNIEIIESVKLNI